MLESILRAELELACPLPSLITCSNLIIIEPRLNFGLGFGSTVRRPQKYV